jgi:hypothetical protein
VEEEELEQVSCEGCGTEVPIDDALTVSNGDLVCDECHYSCERCEWSSSSDDNWTYVGDSRWCDDCATDNSFTCNRCDYTYDTDRVSSYEVDGSDWWCEHCTSDNANYCENCDLYHTGRECYRCEDNDNDSVGVIHNYSYKPNPIFNGRSSDNLFMGFELEIELNALDSRALSSAVSEVEDLEHANTCYLKSDSSIRGTGFELVTHPHTLMAYEQATPLWNYIERLRTEYQGRSWDTDSCGLHVHVSRQTFKSTAHLHRFLWLVYRNPKEMMKLAGRRNSRYAQFSDVYKQDEWGIPRFTLRDKLNRTDYTERYSAVNTQNDYTIELRFFRGNMKREGIMSALELCHAGVEYTRNLNLSDVKLGALSWEWFNDWVDTHNGIYPNLYVRMSKVRTINLDNRPLLNA